MDPILEQAFSRHRDVVERTLSAISSDIERGAVALLETVRAGGMLFTCGNGGSAADSEHLAGEFLCRYKGDRRPLPATSLTSSGAAVSAIGNDYGFEFVFARQIEALGKSVDILVAFTTSGASKNVHLALEAAKKKNMKTIVFTGSGGASLKEKNDVVIIVPSSETARIQEIHELIYHAWCEFLDANLG